MIYMLGLASFEPATYEKINKHTIWLLMSHLTNSKSFCSLSTISKYYYEL